MTGRPSVCSGAMYSTVPNTPPTAVSPVLPNSLAMPKSESLISHFRRDQQIGRLDVAMDHATIVRRASGPGRSARRGVRRLAQVETTSTLDLVFQAAAFDQLHRIEQLLPLLTEAKQADDVRMAELAGASRSRL